MNLSLFVRNMLVYARFRTVELVQSAGNVSIDRRANKLPRPSSRKDCDCRNCCQNGLRQHGVENSNGRGLQQSKFVLRWDP
jgi:hypothetical protein